MLQGMWAANKSDVCPRSTYITARKDLPFVLSKSGLQHAHLWGSHVPRRNGWNAEWCCQRPHWPPCTDADEQAEACKTKVIGWREAAQSKNLIARFEYTIAIKSSDYLISGIFQLVSAVSCMLEHPLTGPSHSSRQGDEHWDVYCRMKNEARWLLVQERHYFHFWFPSRSGTGHIFSLQGSHIGQLRHNSLASVHQLWPALYQRSASLYAIWPVFFKVFVFVIVLAANPTRK